MKFLLVFQLLIITNVNSDFYFNNNACKHLYDYPFWFINPNCYYIEDIDLENDELITNHGYRYEKYEVTTSDGYILTLWRIPSNRNENKQPVFIQHGIMTNSRIFVNTGNQSLAFNLVDLGHDVWLGNFRGSRYSRKHIYYEPSNAEFWNFRLDDLVEKDLPSQINFVANKTGKGGEIIYIGHSMGTTTVFMAAASNIDFQKQLKGIIALSPVCYFNGSHMIEFLAKNAWLIKDVLQSFGIHGLFYQSYLYKAIKISCLLFPYACNEFVKIAFGPPSRQLPPDYLLKIYANFPDGVSVDQLMQYSQISNSGKLRKFDYGKKENVLKYGQEEPPLYELNNIQIPIHMFYGKNDVLSTRKNVERCYREMGSERKSLNYIPLDKNLGGFDHLEFFLGTKLTKLLYPSLFKTIKM